MKLTITTGNVTSQLWNCGNGDKSMNFMKYPVGVLEDKELSIGARALYPFFVQMSNQSKGTNNNGKEWALFESNPAKNAVRMMGIAESTYYKYMRELKKAGYLFVKTTSAFHLTGRKVTCYFIGETRGSAEDVFKNYELKYNRKL